MDSFNKDLIKVLDYAVFESEDGERFHFIGQIPEWFNSLYPEMSHLDKQVKLGKKFLFLAYFLADAKEFWQTKSAERLKSGHWIETDSEGREHQIEAMAVNLKDKKILIMESGHYSYKEKQFILSKNDTFSFDDKLLKAFEHHEKQIRDNLKEKLEAKYQILLDENESLKLRIAELDKK